MGDSFLCLKFRLPQLQERYFKYLSCSYGNRNSRRLIMYNKRNFLKINFEEHIFVLTMDGKNHSNLLNFPGEPCEYKNSY